MKKLLLFIPAAFLLITVQAQQAPNSGMETWITSGNFTNPQFWDTPNEETTAIPFVGAAVVSSSTSAHSGSKCAKLESKNFILVTVPGLMTLANFTINTTTFDFDLSGGVAFAGRPEKFTGYYKYTPQGGDTCAMGAIFYKHNPGGWQDTIGIAFFLESNTVGTWTKFEAYVDWYTPDIPDTMNILVSTSMSMTTTAGTTLYVDDLEFDYSTGISQPLFGEDAALYYNGVGSECILESIEGQKGLLSVYSSTGVLVYTFPVNDSGDHRIQLPKV